MFRRIPWQDLCKFLAGAFFVNAGILFYLYLSPRFDAALGHEFYRDARDQRRALHRPCRSLPDLLLPGLHSKVETPFDHDL
jgi:hypothetical protein